MPPETESYKIKKTAMNVEFSKIVYNYNSEMVRTTPASPNRLTNAGMNPRLILLERKSLYAADTEKEYNLALQSYQKTLHKKELAEKRIRSTRSSRKRAHCYGCFFNCQVAKCADCSLQKATKILKEAGERMEDARADLRNLTTPKTSLSDAKRARQETESADIKLESPETEAEHLQITEEILSRIKIEPADDYETTKSESTVGVQSVGDSFITEHPILRQINTMISFL